ncbi:MAG: flippase [Acetatifactor sp.]|nr:flippase [Acetatifactor sp.]
MGSIKKNFFYNVFYQLLIIAIPLITTPYVSRTIGAEGVGIYSYAYSVANYFVLFTMLGINNYGNRTVAITRDDRTALSRTFSDLYVTQFVLGVLFACLYIVYCFKFASDFYASIILGLYVISGIFDVNWFFNGLEEFKLTIIRNTLVKLICTAAIFVLVKNRTDVYKYCIILASSNLLSQVVLLPFVNKRIDFVQPSYQKVKEHIRPNIMLFSTVLAVSLFKIMDKIMLGLLSDKVQVGFYESAEKVINIPIAFVAALGAVMLPRITNMIANGEKDHDETMQASIIFAMTLSTALCFGIMAVADVFVPLFYGEGFEACIGLFEILLPSCVFLAFANVIRTQYLLPHKMDNIYIISAFMGAGVNIVTNLLLIPHIQARGAAIGTLISEFVVCIFQSYHVHKRMPIKKYAFQSLPMIVAGVVMFVCVRRISLSYHVGVTLMIKVGIGIIIYITTLLISCFPYRKTYLNILSNLKHV